MDELKNNKLFWVLAFMTIFNIVVVLGGKIVIDKAADRVIRKLQKDYSPSPYGPGIDPDRVPSEQIKVKTEDRWREDWETSRSSGR